MTRRNLIHYVRLPQLLVLSLVQPIIFLLLFAFVFGGAIDVGENYVNYIVPALFIQTMIFGSIQTAIGVAEDISGGIVDRFRSLPMSRGALLAGRANADMVRNIFVVFFIGFAGHFIGFTVEGGGGRMLLALVLVVLFGLAFSWVAVAIGLITKQSQAAQVASIIIVFPLFFASSALVPVSSMPYALAMVAQISPVTITIDAVRALLHGEPSVGPVLHSLLWFFIIYGIFIPLSVWQYRKIL